MQIHTEQGRIIWAGHTSIFYTILSCLALGWYADIMPQAGTGLISKLPCKLPVMVPCYSHYNSPHYSICASSC